MATYIQEKMPRFNPNDAEGNLKKLHKYVESLNEQLSYIFENLSGDNFNAKEMSNYVANLTATNIVTQTIISSSVVTKSLYADRGDIAQLTVDWLSTSKKVEKYLNEDTSDDNYIEAHEQGIELKTASVVMSGSEPVTELLHDRYGKALYWQKDITYAEIINGFPYANGKQVYMDNEVTEYPVRVYKYKVDTKMKIDFETAGGVNVPKITMGNVSITDGDVTVNGKSVVDIASRLAAAETEITTLTSDLNTAKGNIATLQSDLVTAKSNISALQSDLSEAKGNITTLQNGLSSAQGNISTMQTAIADLTSRVAALETAKE